MKKIKNILYTCLLSAALFSCADNDMPAGSLQVKDGIPVTLTLSYQMLDDIKVTSRAADGEQTGNDGTTENKKPDDYGLQIFIFNETGVLTGYKSLTETEFHYNESTEQAVEIETLTGKSYIYAVANYNSNRYKVNGLNGEKPNITRNEFLNLKFERDEEELDISEDETKILMSGRYQDETESKRNVNDDGSCTIALDTDGKVVIYNSAGTQDKNPIIYLKRVVSKVTFNIKLSDASKNNVEFKPLSYEIHNITKEGNLLGYLPKEISNSDRKIADYVIEGGYMYENFFIQESPNSFTLYIPENLQKAKNTCDSWHKRETNTYDATTNTKSFTNAPDNGTYVVIKGTYHDTVQKLLANVEYTIHLGDFGGTDENTRNYNNFDNERNCEYTYNVMVKNVNEITVEAHKKENDNLQEYPGTEGLVINYSKGKTYTVDSHYEAVIMRIYKSENNVYQFMVETPWGGMSECVSTNDEDYSTKLANLDVNWLSFALVSDVVDAVNNSSTDYCPTDDNNTYKNAMNNMAYKSDNPKGGNVPFLAYTYTKNGNTDNLKCFQDFFNYLTKGNVNWEKDDTDNKEYIDVICFIDEYYYSDDKYAIDIAKGNTTGTKKSRYWNEYTNTTPRSFYLLETVAVSPDGHSTYMEVSHSISQYSIQTFYNPSKAKDIMAYGCEYINNEELLPYTNGVPKTSYGFLEGNGDATYDYWDGRKNTMNDISTSFIKNATSTTETTGWKTILSDVSTDTNGQQSKLCWAFVDRNRDLNRDGNIDQDEIRWYTPTISQYCGFWMGEDAIATEARLYNGKLTDLSLNSPYKSSVSNPEMYRHYYSSTPELRIFWAEEGSTYGPIQDSYSNELPHFLRCIRNLGIDNNGVQLGVNTDGRKYIIAPDMYYKYENMKFDLSNTDPKTLRTGAVLKTLLSPHAERRREGDEKNNNLARVKFELALNRETKSYTLQQINLGDYYENKNSKTPTSNNYSPIQLSANVENSDVNIGVWRIPNQKELCLIALETYKQIHENSDLDKTKLLGYTYDACATFSSNLYYRLGYYIRYATNNENIYLTAMADETYAYTSQWGDFRTVFKIRPVRDIAE